MKCAEIQEHLSAYHDGELGEAIHDAVRSHLVGCEACAGRLSEFADYTDLISRIPKPNVPPAVWSGIAEQLDRQPVAHSDASAGVVAVERQSWLTTGRFALAASLLLMVGVGLWLARSSDHASHHGVEFATTMDHYVKTLATNPDLAEEFLLRKYDGTKVAPSDARRLVGFRPAVASGLPEEYTLASTSVLRMPCCTCVKAVCKRQDGSTLVLFEHDDNDTQWFGGRPSRMATCGERECCLVDLDENMAATWKRGSRWMTAIGARDHHEVGKLAAWLDQEVARETATPKKI